MTMVPIDIPAGVLNEASRDRLSSNWRETHLIRWIKDTVMPIPGWEKLNYAAFPSRVRLIHKWMANNQALYIAYLCERHCFVDVNGTLYDVTPVGGFGPMDTGLGGYGDDKYSMAKYGTPRPANKRTLYFGDVWSMDNWGDQLRVMTSYDGRLLKWDPMTPSTKLVAVANAPVNNRSFIITPERHIMLFAMGGKIDSFGWCNQEDDTNWAFLDVTSKAGKYDLEPTAQIVTATQFEGGVYMSTMGGNYYIRSTGLPYIYSYKPAPEAPIPVSAHSVCAFPDGVIWVGVDSYWIFNGVSTQPLLCPVIDWVRRKRLMSATVSQAFLANIHSKSELWWFFCSTESADNNTYVVIYNYRVKWWTMGRISRTCAVVYGNEFNPYMSDGVNVYKHEIGFTYPGEAMPWAETFEINMEYGDKLSTFHQMRPEMTRGRDKVKYRLIKQMDRSKPETEQMTPQRSVFGDGLVDFRETARDFRLRLDMVANDDWSIGPMLMDIRKRGKK